MRRLVLCGIASLAAVVGAADSVPSTTAEPTGAGRPSQSGTEYSPSTGMRETVKAVSTGRPTVTSGIAKGTVPRFAEIMDSESDQVHRYVDLQQRIAALEAETMTPDELGEVLKKAEYHHALLKTRQKLLEARAAMEQAESLDPHSHPSAGEFVPQKGPISEALDQVKRRLRDMRLSPDFGAPAGANLN